MIMDTHSHYDDKRFDPDRKKLLCSMKEKGVERIINSGADLEGCIETIRMTQEYDFVYGTIGIHPSETKSMSENTLNWLREHSSEKKIVAIGEIGLDYYWSEPDHETQAYWFKRQLALARECGLPVVIHSRDAAKDTMSILKAEHAGEIGGTIHCFSYSKEMAEEYVKMGFYIGIGGVVTFKNGKRLKEAVQTIPLSRILLETDCPYLSPEPFRGKRNDSSLLIYVAEEIARLKNKSVEEVIETTTQNAKALYGVA